MNKAWTYVLSPLISCTGLFGMSVAMADGDAPPTDVPVPQLETWLIPAGDPHYVRIDFNSLHAGLLEGQAGGEGFAASSAWDAGSSVIRLLERDLTPPPPTPQPMAQFPPRGLEGLDITEPDPHAIMYVPSQRGTPRLLQGTVDRPRQQSRELAESMDGSVWFRFLVRATTDEATGGIGFNQRRSWDLRPNISASGRNLVIQYPAAAHDVVVSDVFTPDETALVVGRIDINAGPAGEDFLSIWVNPDVRDVGDPLIFLTYADFVGDEITRLGLVTHGGPDNRSGAELDEIILSNFAYPAGLFHVLPRLRFQGRGLHLPVEPATEVTPLPPEGYKLVWSDEFDGDAVDETKWTYRLRGKADSEQLKENVEVKDGHLVIHLRKEQHGQYEYTGGGVHSLDTFVYGYYESRLKVPSAEGWHTAFWVFPEVFKTGSEIDFIEQDSGDPYLFSIGASDKRFPPWPDRSVGRWIVTDAPNMAEDFIVIGGEFTPDFVRFYMNGKLLHEMDSGIFPHAPMDVRLTAIASRKKGDRFQDDARLPDNAMFNYVRVYQHPKYREAEEAARAEPQLRIDRINPAHRAEVERILKYYPPLMIDDLTTWPDD